MNSDKSNWAKANNVSWVGQVVAMILFCLGALIVCPLMDNISPNDTMALIVYACFGIFLSFVAWSAIWFSLLDASWVMRLFALFGVTFCFWLAWFLGFVFTGNFSSAVLRDQGFRLILCIPLAYLAVQAPLWIMSLWFGWRIYNPASIRSPGRGLSVSDLMLATAFVAGAMACFQLASSQFAKNYSQSEILIGLGIGLGVCILGSTISALPAVVFCLQERKWSLSWSLIAVHFAVVAVLTFVGYMVAQRVTTNRFNSWEVISMEVVFLVFLSGVYLPLMAAKAGGYRLGKINLKQDQI